MGSFARAGAVLDKALAAIDARVPWESPTRRRAWLAVAILMAIVPAAFAASREPHFSSAVEIYPRDTGPFPGSHDVRVPRALLRDPGLRNQVRAEADVGASAFRHVRIDPLPARRTFVLTVTQPTPTAARRLADSVALRLAYTSGAQVAALAAQQVPGLQQRLRTAGGTAGQLRVVRRRLARLRQLGSPRAAIVERELRSTNRKAARRTTLARQLAEMQRVAQRPPNPFVPGAPATVPRLTRWSDRLVDALPGGFTGRPSPFWAGVAGLALAALAWALSLRFAPPRRRVEAPRPTARASHEAARPRWRARERGAPAAVRAHVSGGNPGHNPHAAQALPARDPLQGPTATGSLVDGLELPEWARRAFARAQASRSLPVICFALASVAAGLYIMYAARGSFFHADDWDMMVYRTDLSAPALLSPHNDHLIAVQVAIFNLLREVAGWHYGAYRLTMVLLHLAIATCVFIFVRRRVGPWLALAFVLPLLVLGAGGDGLLFPGVMANSAALATGVAALLVVERLPARRWHEALAFVLLMLSVASVTFGVIFALAAAVWIGATPARRRSLWVAVVPLLAYAAWKVAYPSSSLSLENVVHTPRFVADSAAAAFGAITGLGRYVGYVPALVGTVVTAYVLVTRKGRGISTYVIVGLPVVTWIAIGIGRAATQPAGLQPRYIYVGAALVLLVVAELLAGRRLPPAAVGTLAAIAIAGTAYNIGQLRDQGNYFRGQAVLARTYVGAVEVAHPVVSPQFGLGNFPNSPGLGNVIGSFQTAAFDGAVRQVGAEPVEHRVLDELPPDKRQIVDGVLVAALRLRLTPTSRASLARTSRACVRIGPADGALELDLRTPGTVVVRAGTQPATVYVRRYADPATATPLGTVPRSESQSFVIPRDRSNRAWFARVDAAAPVRVCRV